MPTHAIWLGVLITLSTVKTELSHLYETKFQTERNCKNCDDSSRPFNAVATTRWVSISLISSSLLMRKLIKIVSVSRGSNNLNP